MVNLGALADAIRQCVAQLSRLSGVQVSVPAVGGSVGAAQYCLQRQHSGLEQFSRIQGSVVFRLLQKLTCGCALPSMMCPASS